MYGIMELLSKYTISYIQQDLESNEILYSQVTWVSRYSLLSREPRHSVGKKKLIHATYFAMHFTLLKNQTLPYVAQKTRRESRFLNYMRHFCFLNSRRYQKYCWF